MVKHAALAATAALSLALTGRPAAALTPDTAWVKAGSSGETTMAALDDCVAQSKNVNAQYTPGYTTPGLAGGVGSALGNAIYASVVNAAAQRAFIPACMHYNGYVRLRVTAQESETDRKAKTRSEHVANLQAIYAAPDFAARYAVASRRVVPLPLPDSETFAYRDLRLDPTTLTVIPGEVDKGAVLEGDVRRRAVATLVNDVKWDDFPEVIPAGTVFQEFVLTGPDGAAWNYWCWQRRYLAAGAHQDCVRVDPQGQYHLSHIPVTMRGLMMLPTSGRENEGFNDVDFVLHPETKDPLDPIHMELSVRKVDGGGVTLAIDALTVNKQKRVLWSQYVAFDANGDAVLPFWTHRLKLHHTSRGVTAALTPDGDGKPLPANDPNRCMPGLNSLCI